MSFTPLTRQQFEKGTPFIVVYPHNGYQQAVYVTDLPKENNYGAICFANGDYLCALVQVTNTGFSFGLFVLGNPLYGKVDFMACMPVEDKQHKQ